MERRGDPVMRALLRYGVIAACVMLAACESPTLPPRSVSDFYDFRLVSDTLHVFHWPTGSNVRVYVHPSGNAARDSMMITAFERGAAEWNTYALFGEYYLRRAASLADADAVIRWSDVAAPVNSTQCPPVFSNGVTTFCIEDLDAAQLRLASFPPLPPADTSARNVKMLVTILASQSTIPGRIDRLVAHELGHVLGIGQHSPDVDDLMAAGVPPRATLTRRDITTVQVLYHTTPDILP